MEAMGTRNLGFLAGTASAYGLNNSEALNLITLNPAKILGIDTREGSLEVGKKACFFISNGNALDMMYLTVNQIYIDGKVVDNSTFQKDLYQKYQRKYGLN
jgi:imidazolonepropionase-like amidohydrolase